MSGGLRVSQFVPAGSLQGTDILGIVRGNENFQTTADDFLTAVGTGFTSVATRAAMATVNNVAHPYVILTEAGREGIFVWDGSNLATLVTADARQGVYIAPSTDLTGASGAWVRKFSGFYNVRWFGAVGDDVTNDGTAFTGAIALLRALRQSGYGYSGGSPGLLIPKGKYFLGVTTLDITSTMIITGEGGAGAQGPTSLLRWSAGATGIRLQGGNTTGAAGTQADDGTGADGSIIRNLGLIGGRVAADGNFHAVHFRTVASVRDLYIERWEGDAMFATCTAGSGGATEGNANCLQVDRIYVENVRRALYLDGGDVNAGRFAGIVVKGTSQEGIFDSSFLGNTHLGHHVAGSVGAAYKSDGLNARNVFVGCYSESDCAASDILSPSVVVGGLHAAGFTAGTTAPILGNAGVAFDYFGSGAAQFGQTRVTFPTASGHVVALHNNAAMGGGIYSTLRFEQGIESGTTPAALGAIRIRSTTASPATNEAIMEFQTRTFAGGGALTTRVNLDGPNLSWRPETDNNMDSGLAAFRWKTFYGYIGNFTTSLVINGVTVIDNTSRLLAAAFPALTGDVTTAGGALATTIASHAVSNAKFRQSVALSVVGNSTNALADVADIAAGADFNIMRRSGTAIGFGSIDLSQAGAVGTSRLAHANQVQITASKLLGNPTGSTADESEIGLAGGLGFSGTNLTINGAVNAATSVTTSGALTSSGGGVGYATGAGGTVAQATSKTTAVTLNKLCGTITLVNTSIAADSTASFTFNNSFIAAGDRIVWNHESVGTFGAYNLNSHAHAAGSCTVDVHNVTPGALAEAIVIGFSIVKSVTA